MHTLSSVGRERGGGREGGREEEEEEEEEEKKKRAVVSGPALLSAERSSCSRRLNCSLC